MAIAAEAFVAAPQYRGEETYWRASDMPWIDADAVPELLAARLRARTEAEAIFEARMQHLRDGEFDAVPYEVDPLTTAGRVIAAEKTYGKKSVEYAVAYESLKTDSQRTFAEALRKLAWEYFAPLEQPFNMATNSYEFKGRSLTDMVKDGITPLVANPEDKACRFNEYGEERTYTAIRALGSLSVGNVVLLRPAAPIMPEQPVSEPLPELHVLTISECADWAIEAHKNGGKDFKGRVPEIKKLMIRGVRFNRDSDTRAQMQLGVSGEHITHDVVVETMRRLGVIAPDAELSKIDVQAKQMINVHGEGVVELGRKLDQVASEFSGKRIFLGEEVPADHPCNYESVPAEAAERQKQLEASSIKLADYLIELEKNGTDHFAAGGLVERFVQAEVLELTRDNPEQAAIAFNDAIADRTQQYTLAKAAGDYRMAELIWEEIKMTAPPVSFCGAGSCGLEGVSMSSNEAITAKKLGLEGAKDGDLLHDTLRTCSNPECNQRKVYYDKKGNKVCTACGNNTTGVVATISNFKPRQSKPKVEANKKP